MPKLKDFVSLLMVATLAIPTLALAQAKPAQRSQPVPARAGSPGTTATPPVVPVQQPGQAGAQPGSAPGGSAAPASEYVLGPEDVVEVEVVGTNDKTRARIYTDGTLQLNMG